MDFTAFVSDAYLEDCAHARLRSAAPYRAGDSSQAIRLVGTAAASLERMAAAIRRWAREPGDTNVSPNRSALVRR